MSSTSEDGGNVISGGAEEEEEEEEVTADDDLLSDTSPLYNTFYALKAENDALRANFDALKDVHVTLANKCRALDGDKAQKDTQLRNLQQLLEQWRLELEQKQVALDEAKSQALTQGQVESLRQRIIAEIEGPHREQCAALEREAEGVQEQLNILRREHDRMRGEHEYSGAKHAKELAESRTEHDAERDALNREAEALKARVAKLASASTRATALEQELAAKSRALSDLKSEVEAVRREKEAAANAAAAEVFNASNGASRHAERLLEMKRATEVAERRARHASAELAAVQSANEMLNQQLMQAETQLAAARASLDERARKHEEEVAAERRKAANAERAWEAERASLAEANAQRESRLTELAREYKADVARVRAEGEAATEAAGDRFSAERRRLESMLAEAKARVESLEASRVTDGKEADRRHETLKGEVLAAQRDAVDARAEARASQRAAEKLTAELEESRATTTRVRDEADRIAEENRRNVGRLGELAQQLEEARTAVRRLEANVAAANAESAESARKMEVARAENDLNIQAAKRQAEFQSQTIIARATEFVGDLETRYMSSIGKARRKLRRAGARLRGAAKDRAQMLIRQGELDARNSALRRAHRGLLNTDAAAASTMPTKNATGEIAAQLAAMKAAAEVRLKALNA
ncbi:coiled-coil domain containing 41 [Pycnococcus provasolii]|uniref:Coiled-coil domain containing 41 n=1 Tax=Pycnococcus provasolii TaxID=41880 RepID=A0A830HRU9_9CHLO|nr:coiled-coil domain containing 41 [Pycnococcus provasolii]